MSAKVFIPQAVIDTWVAGDRVDVSGDVLSLRGGGALRLGPASLFLKLSAGADQPHALLGKVKGEQDIARLGGESYMTSVILGDSAYEVEPGFMGDPIDGTDRAALLAALRELAG